MQVEGDKVADVSRTLKAGPDEGLADGEAVAMVSVYGVVDTDSDRVKEGEWDAFVADFKSKGDPIPVLFAHDHRNPLMYVGEVHGFDPRGTNAKGESGLVANVKFDHEDADNPYARAAYKLAKGRRVTQWSYHYRGERAPADDLEGVFDLKGLSMTEASLVLRGANRSTDTLAIKGEKARGSSFADLEAMLNPETVDMVRALEPEQRLRLASAIAEFVRPADDGAPAKGEKGEPHVEVLSVIEAELELERLRLVV